MIGSLLGPILGIIDKVIPNKDDANKLKAELERQLLDHRTELSKTMREIAIRETSGNWFQSSWRPLLSYTFIGLLIAKAFGWADGVSSDDLLTFGGIWAGVYGIGRSWEKSGSSFHIGRD